MPGIKRRNRRQRKEVSLSSTLHNPEYIRKTAELGLVEGRKLFGDLALKYLSEHEDYGALIHTNLAYFGLPSDSAAVENVVKHIGYHYHEKFLSFSREPAFYPSFHSRVARPDDMIDELLANQREKKPTFILSAHFGAMALIPGVLNSRKLDISSIIRFPSEQIKQLIVSKGTAILEALGYGRTKFFEIDKQPVMDLVYGLEDGETFFSVLDEHTEFDVDITFLGKTIGGGAGIDRIVNLVGRQEVRLYFTEMVRDGDSYTLGLHRIDVTGDDYIQNMFRIHEGYVSKHPEQWFFLQEVHENMPEHP
ncbi:MAG: hypothetical protein GF331_12525 [Chitinivibrionales bacterium]|nr:hypothetical protein [Chitinivibrionales bacterium]